MMQAPSVCWHETEGHRSLRQRVAGWCGQWLVAVLAPTGLLQADAVLAPWGNLTGIRVDGEWVGFEAGLRVVHPDWSGFSGAVKYLQKPTYTREGNRRTVASKIDELAFTAALRDTSPGEAVLDLTLVAEANLEADGVYFCVELPAAEFGGGYLQVRGGSRDSRVALPAGEPSLLDLDWRANGSQVRIAGKRQRLELHLGQAREIRLRRLLSDRPTSINDPKVAQTFETRASGTAGDYQVYVRLTPPNPAAGDRVAARISFKATAAPDAEPVRLELDSTRLGRPFDGIGGNFRLQFPRTDPAVTQYNLDHLRVAWGRIELPWAEWDPDETSTPLETARAGRLEAKVHDASVMAQSLARRGMPVIVSVWNPPRWARAAEPQPAGLRGIALDLAKAPRLWRSLADYLVFLKERYGVEARFFSFNEPETGVEIRQTAAEHAQFVRAMGAELRRRELSTRVLLGDTAHGTAAALRFLAPALADPEARAQAGGIAFHTWRGCTPGELQQWSAAAGDLGVPLLVTEGGPDAHLHEYAGVRLEPWFALQEIDLYVRVCAFGQPVTIMEWQLNTDYAVLVGGGVYDETGPLRPTQRFWSLRQLGNTPEGARALPILCDSPTVTAAAFGDQPGGAVTVHLVNRGGRRRAVLSGLPESTRDCRILVTDATRGMFDLPRVKSRRGRAELLLPPASYVTLVSGK